MVCVLGSPVSAQVVRHHYSQRDLAALPLWTVSAPDLTIGVLDGADPYVFAGLGSVQVLDDGSIAATNWSQYEARGEEFASSAQSRRQLPVAEEFPATGRLLVDADGLVWVQVNTRPSQPAERWLVADGTGRLIARVEAPEGFSLRDAAAGRAYGVGRDEWDVERLERRPIGKPGGERRHP
jgi:hypothetical protein